MCTIRAPASRRRGRRAALAADKRSPVRRYRSRRHGRCSRRLRGKEVTMVRWAFGFLGIAFVAALVGFTGIAREAAVAGKWIFCTCLVLTGVSLLQGPRTVT
jgi:uncharacterized membrane protein YtjA (UPF0391 family)